jgi:uncharacterized protein YjiS (DUF1127 family)
MTMTHRPARFQAEWTPVRRPESAPAVKSRAHSDAKPIAREDGRERPSVSIFAECALAGRVASAVEEPGLPAPVRLLLTIIRRVRARRELAALDADQLRDVGLDRDMIRREIAKPFWRA